MILLNFWRVR